ncbi:hypothetical protein HA050_18780 [Iodobacter sp. HSC-16F04]|uniref:Uncharacterized protein n=1 Tax=Iodobacter violaceini TaxID=3044271 RepID=A0ABX0L3W2_9NEIS|nr:hypothetical protein [Iodobacter violacea]NHQ88156.1 hypothetical protein [Iodobacter violacea]
MTKTKNDRTIIGMILKETRPLLYRMGGAADKKEPGLYTHPKTQNTEPGNKKDQMKSQNILHTQQLTTYHTYKQLNHQINELQ